MARRGSTEKVRDSGGIPVIRQDGGEKYFYGVWKGFLVKGAVAGESARVFKPMCKENV
jgi:hypothetical protein